MKKISFLLLSLLFVICFLSCSDDDEDASILLGTWRFDGDPEIEIVSNNQEATELIKKEVKRLTFSGQLQFDDNGEFGHSNYDEKGTRISYFSGKYYRKDSKLYGEYLAFGTFNVSTIFLYVTDNDRDHLTVSLNALNFFNTRDQLRIIGMEDPTGVNVSSVSIKYNYVRQ